MSRSAGERYQCGECGATIVYEKACPCCKSATDHAETCCGKQMSKVT